MRIRRGGKFVIGICLVIAALIAFRAYLPYLVQDYVNRTLDRIPEYDGRIGDVDLHLWRGAYSIEGVKLVKTTGKIPVPFLESPLIEFSIEWKALFQGKVVAQVHAEAPELHFVNAENTNRSQLQIGDEWLQAVKDLFPLRLNRFEIAGGIVHFHDFGRSPEVHVKMTHVNLVGTDFTNTRSPSEGLTASIHATAKIEDHAHLESWAKISPSNKSPTFALNTSVRQLRLTSLNDFLKAYAAIDAEQGTVSIDCELSAENNRFQGYVKPLLKDVQIFHLEKDSAHPLSTVWQALVGVFAEIFENQKHEQIGTQVPFSGTFEEPEPHRWAAIMGVLYNAFIEAFKPGIEEAAE